MELVRIEKLLDKYFEANTTVAEEKILREYFSGEDIAPHLAHHAPMFNYLSLAREEKSERPVPLKRRTNPYKWLSIAAVVVLALGIYFGNDSYQEYQQQKKAEYAYNETKKALNLLASNLGRGTEKVAYLNEFEEAKQKIYKND